ncbi:SRPBCC family protein [Serratia rubidaea]|uniref:SRPBCC family protein n=1 Tax=Serratia rubidaea TaxID=61652 RepID=UPI0023498AE5|nr:SRPBCC family protein [Serratia rubidaea]MDC6110538.1 SRPBCC family protein [Serratia rubidaea]
MNTLTFSVDVAAPADVIWAIWADLEASPQWDTDVVSCRLEGAFAPGTRGLCKLKNGLRMSIVLEEIEVGRRWRNAARLLGATLRFDHQVEALTPATCRVTHRGDVSQVNPWLWRKVMQALLRPALNNALRNLAHLAEQRAQEAPSILPASAVQGQ